MKRTLPSNRYDTWNARKERSKPKEKTLKCKIRSLDKLIRYQEAKGVNLVNKKRLLNNLKLQFKEREEQKKIQDKERKIARRNHKVRFVERVKIVRKLLQAHKKDDKELFEKFTIDLKYILFFPKGEKYISLFKDLSEDQQIKRKSLETKALRTAEAEDFKVLTFLRGSLKTEKNFENEEQTELNESADVLKEEEDDFFL